MIDPVLVEKILVKRVKDLGDDLDKTALARSVKLFTTLSEEWKHNHKISAEQVCEEEFSELNQRERDKIVALVIAAWSDVYTE